MVLIGLGLPVSGAWATPREQVRLARRAEALGYHSLWTFQRLLVPARAEGRAAMEVYRSVHDPIVSLAHVAGQTERVRLGVAVLNMPFYSPALLAKQLATLDVIAGGRLDVGLGIGWSREEYAASGAPYEQRGARAEEFLAALRALWTSDVIAFHGRFYDIPASRMEPKPAQEPHPPILLGGSAAPALRRAGRLADGWISASSADPDTYGEAVRTISEAATEAGRDPATLRFVARVPIRLDPGDGGAAGSGERAPYTGSHEQISADLDRLRQAGATEAFLDLNWDPRLGSPDADAGAAPALADKVLEAFAPA